MANTLSITKRSLIGKANSTIVVMAAVAAFVIVFSLVAGKALTDQAKYQNKVIAAKKKSLNQLKADLAARNSLVDSYHKFVVTNPNMLGGNTDGTGDQDGDNAKLVLDALPSKYDFPALATSLEKILTGQNLKIQTIAGSDDEIAQEQGKSS